MNYEWTFCIFGNSNRTFHPTEFHLPICISKAFQFDFTCLNICRVILKFHLACNVKVDPCGVANLAVIVDSYRGWSHKIRGNSQFFSLNKEINICLWSWEVPFLINQYNYRLALHIKLQQRSKNTSTTWREEFPWHKLIE